MPEQPDPPATKSDIRRLDERGDAIQSDIRRLAAEFVRSNAQRDKMEERLSRLIREEGARLRDRLDRLMEAWQVHSRCILAIRGTLAGHEQLPRDQERRPGALESHRA